MKSKRSFIKKKRILVSRLFIVVVVLVVLFSGSYWEQFDLYSTTLFLMGAVLVGLATVGRLWCSLYISGYKKSSTLIKTGPYSICRNPLYFFSLLGGIGVGLATETLTIPAIIIIAFACYYPLVIKKEQQRLRQLHGQEYEAYCNTTPSFIPALKLFNEPQEYNVKPRIFRRSLFEAMWFFWFVGILELIEALHEAGLVPVIIKLY